MNAHGTRTTRVTNNPSEDGEPQWTPDGNTIVFYSDRSGTPQIYTMRADGSGVVQLTFSAGPNWEPTVSIDGRRVAFSCERQDPGRTSEIFVINLDGTGETQITYNSAWDLEPSWPGR